MVEEEEIPVDFASPREAKMHLRFTGVSPRHPSLPVRPDKETAFPTLLTYRVLYISAARPLTGRQENS